MSASFNHAVLLYINVGHRLYKSELDEFVDLVNASGAIMQNVFCVNRHKPDPKYFLGTGKAQEIREYVEENDIHLLITNQNLSPAQERNLEQLCKARILGYSGLILDIFSRRARSHEGKLQVELAQLVYLSTRLVRGWSHLERQKGGIGLRGPGEKQLETDRRLIRHRIKKIKHDLKKIEKRRFLGRRSRHKNGVMTVALVGYTNAGKSTLFSSLTSAHTYVADMPFATLDTLMRSVYFAELGTVIISDTVGFIRDLPPTLIDAFNATLLEVREADLLLHIVDIASDDYQQQCHQVEKILSVIGAAELPQLTVFNKTDIAGCEVGVRYDAEKLPIAVSLSARTGAGLDLLRQALCLRLSGLASNGIPPEVCVPAE